MASVLGMEVEAPAQNMGRDLDISLTEGYKVKGHHPLLRNDLFEQAKRRLLPI